MFSIPLNGVVFVVEIVFFSSLFFDLTFIQSVFEIDILDFSVIQRKSENFLNFLYDALYPLQST